MTDRPTLRRLLGADGPEALVECWGRRPLLRTAAERGGDDVGDLFSLEAVDELVSRRGLRTPFLRVAKDGSTLPERQFTSGGGIGAGIGDQVSEDRLLQLFGDGATIVLQGLHRTWDPVRRAAAGLAADLGHPVQVNAYVTPPQNQGFSAHYDVHDVVVVQVHGRKRWTISEPVLPAPLRDQPWTDRAAEVAARAREAAYLDVDLAPGDVLYLPRGWIHAARALGGVTAHLTFGIHQWTRHHLAEAIVERATTRLGDDPDLRASLPLGPDLTDLGSLAEEVAGARRALLRAIEELPDTEVLRVLRRRERAAQRPEPLGPLAQLAAAEELTADTVLRLREALLVDLLPGPEEGTVVVSSRAGRLTLDSHHVPALRALLDARSGRVADLAADPATALDLGRRLVRHGLVLVDGGRLGD
ncbi:cupin superfamily protein [Ornithinimicrobium humiphilum]|uniref:Cupin superfamily protein n=1 Tax=Ornithinimicrobium humiphilum TaxID=125288 RepID=A0A543KM61_9MICO|nr:cupin domain-containing protein [Ornithinimicrobium humiphilum]TQM96173.1 cupin superfamily protein [Ornithinimicrobium humiphilum]